MCVCSYSRILLDVARRRRWRRGLRRRRRLWRRLQGQLRIVGQLVKYVHELLQAVNGAGPFVLGHANEIVQAVLGS